MAFYSTLIYVESSLIHGLILLCLARRGLTYMALLR